MNKITPTLINIALGIAIGLAVAGIWIIAIKTIDTNKKQNELNSKQSETDIKVNYIYEKIMKSDINK